jgi:F420-non-reducing hydrogenase iron-sulfur subunit
MTAKRIEFTRRLLEFSGIEPDRLILKWVSSAEGPRFAQVVTEFVDSVKRMGPSPLKGTRQESFDASASGRAIA